MRLIFDVETDGLLEATAAKGGGLDGEKPKATKVHCLVVKDLDTGEVLSCTGANTYDEAGVKNWPADEGVRLLSQADEVIGHNIITFDLPILEKFYGLKLKPGCKVLDTLNCSTLIWADMLIDLDYRNQGMTKIPAEFIGKHSLEAWGYRVGLRKGSFNNDRTDWSKWTPEMQSYCERDVEVTEKLYRLIEGKNYSKEAIDLEIKFQQIIHHQEQSGFAFDERFAQEVYAKMAAERDILKRKLQEVFPPRVEALKTPDCWFGYVDGLPLPFPTKGAAQKAKARDIVPGPLRTKTHPFNPDSSDQIAERFAEKYGWKPTAFTPSGKAKIDDEILSDLPFDEAKPLAEYAVLVKRIAQIAEGKQGWLKHVRNGRLYGGMRTNGAVTGRCTHSLVVNVPKAPQPWGHEMRSVFTASPGWWLVGCDASGLEARCQAHFMTPIDGGKFMRSVLEGDKSKGTDIHSINRDALGLEPTSANREAAKTWYYAFIYGSGNFKSGLIVGVTPEELVTYNGAGFTKQQGAAKKWLDANNLAVTSKNVATHVKGGILKKRFLEKSPELALLIKNVQTKAKQQGYLRGLDGRILNIRAAYSSFNTLLQSAGALVMKKALCLFWEEAVDVLGWKYGEDFKLVANVHDEIQAEAPTKEQAEAVGKLAAWAIHHAGRHFKFNCPLDGEFKVGKNWHETH